MVCLSLMFSGPGIYFYFPPWIFHPFTDIYSFYAIILQGKLWPGKLVVVCLWRDNHILPLSFHVLDQEPSGPVLRRFQSSCSSMSPKMSQMKLHDGQDQSAKDSQAINLKLLFSHCSFQALWQKIKPQELWQIRYSSI